VSSIAFSSRVDDCPSSSLSIDSASRSGADVLGIRRIARHGDRREDQDSLSASPTSGYRSDDEFDERDLITYVEEAGFREVHLDLEANIKPLSDAQGWKMTWESFLRTAANPKIPTLEEAMAQALTDDEAAGFAAHMRPLVEHQVGTYRFAVAYLSAKK
jgi:ppGpp synthetase/RelA/SpoT-type nucleotidyltranferase